MSIGLPPIGAPVLALTFLWGINETGAGGLKVSKKLTNNTPP
jgi:hypothetical protein